MPLFGTLETMPLTDLLQWVGTARLSGTLQIERDKVAKAIVFENGQIVGCSSDDPPERLGQFLISRGMINEDLLREALRQQSESHRHLGMILVEMGALPADELAAHLEAKAEETLYSLFDWQEAVFRFQQDARDEANVFPISVRVEDVLLRGLRRFDEMQRIRQVFHDPGIVLTRTDKEPPVEVRNNVMANRLYDAIDGQRSVADIRLHVHGSEYVVTKFLYELHRTGFVKITGIQRRETPDAPPEPRAASASAAPAEPTAAADPLAGIDFADATAEPSPLPDPPEDAAIDRPATAEATAEVTAEPTEDSTALEPAESSDAHRLSSQLARARSHMQAAEFEAALDILDALYREFPGDEALRRLTAEAEITFIEKAYRHYLPPAKIPVVKRSVQEIGDDESFSPTEFFLLSRIDGSWDVRSIIQVAPLREVETLRAMKRMRENGVIELRDPNPN